MDRNRLLGHLIQVFAVIGLAVSGLVLGSARAGDTAAMIGVVLCVGAFFGGARLAQRRSTA